MSQIVNLSGQHLVLVEKSSVKGEGRVELFLVGEKIHL